MKPEKHLHLSYLFQVIQVQILMMIIRQYVANLKTMIQQKLKKLKKFLMMKLKNYLKTMTL